MYKRLAILLVSATTAWSQPGVERVQTFSHTDTPERRAAMVTALRTVVDNKQLTVDESAASLKLSGSPDGVAVAEWLFEELDRSPLVQRSTDEPFDRFAVPGSSGEVASAFFYAHPATRDEAMRTVNAVRTMTEIIRVVSFDGAAVLLRAQRDRVQDAEWLLLHLDHPADLADQTRHITINGRESTIKLFYAGDNPKRGQLDEILNAMRMVTGTPRMSSTHGPDAIVMRHEESAAIDLGTWVFHELDQPNTAEKREYRLAARDAVRIFYVGHTGDKEALTRVGTAVRTATQLERLQIVTSLGAIVARGTPDQMERAERVIDGKDAGTDSPTPTKFDVVSIKPAQTSDANPVQQNHPDGIELRNYELSSVVMTAYSPRFYQIRAPGWMDSERFDISAKATGPVSREQIKTMLQALLVERFHLATHIEKQTIQGYALVVAKGGLKIHPVPADKSVEHRPRATRRGQVNGKDAPMQDLQGQLQSQLDCPIIDETHVDGVFDYDLRFTLDTLPSTSGGSIASAPVSSVFDVLEEKLGLKLEKRRVQVEVLIVDHADKVAIEN